MRGTAATAPRQGAMSLRFATYGRDWKQSAEGPLDVRVCECCPTSAAVTDRWTDCSLPQPVRRGGSRHPRHALRAWQMDRAGGRARRWLEDCRLPGQRPDAERARAGMSLWPGSAGRTRRGVRFCRSRRTPAGRSARRFGSTRAQRSAASTSSCCPTGPRSRAGSSPLAGARSLSPAGSRHQALNPLR